MLYGNDFYFLGYIPKKDIKKVIKKADKIAKSIGTTDKDGSVIQYAHLQSYLHSEIKPLYFLGTGQDLNKSIGYKILHKGILKDFSDKYGYGYGEHFIYRKNKNFLYALSLRYMWAYLKHLKNLTRPLKKDLTKLTKKDKANLDKLCSLITWEDCQCKSALKYNSHNRRSYMSHCITPYNENYWNYKSYKLFEICNTFDYENNVLCLYTEF